MEQIATIQEAIERRKSVRSFDQSGLPEAELKQITDYAAAIEPLIPGTKIKAEVIGPDDVKSIMKWRAPHYLAIYAEDSDAGLMSVGYIYEQVVLYMASLGIGTCWATSISPQEKHEDDGTKWAAVVAFGKPDGENALREAGQAKRKSLAEISDREDEMVEAARLAPSSMNNQPWRFEHDGDAIHIYCKKQGLLKKWMVSQNRIDIGIALGNMKAANSELRFYPSSTNTEKDGYTLMGTVHFE